MNNHTVESRNQIVPFFAVYQIVGGVMGILLTIWLLVTSDPRVDVVLLCVVFILLYSFSAYSGILLWRDVEKIWYSIYSQLLQLVSFNLMGIAFTYFSGLAISLGYDFNSGLLLFYGGLSKWELTVSASDSVQISINLVSLYLILHMLKIDRRVKNRKLEDELLKLTTEQASTKEA
jgi:hypothetical protein